MSDKDPAPLKPNRPKLALHVPEPPFRPGDKPDFSGVKVPAAGSAPRPDVAASVMSTTRARPDTVAIAAWSAVHGLARLRLDGNLGELLGKQSPDAVA